MSNGAWIDTTGADSYVPDLAAAPSISTLPLPEAKDERDAIAKQERRRKAQGIGFAPARPGNEDPPT